MSDLLVIQVAVPDEALGLAIAQALMEKRLVACAQIVPGTTSVYRWNGQIERSREALLLLKTHADRYGEVDGTVKSLHPYETPEIIATPVVRYSEEYAAWIVDSVQARA